MKINITLPCYNEEKIIKKNVLKLYSFCKKELDDLWFIIIADNASEDNTGEISRGLANLYPEIKYLYLPEKGKGRAIRRSWQTFPADFYVFFDVDLSTDISILLEMINVLKKDKYQGVIGSRSLQASEVKRSFLRKLISKIYNNFIRMILGVNVRDMSCGAKAFNNKIIKKVLPEVLNNQWFFDSELVVLTIKNGYKIKEIPAVWQEFGERKTRVSFLRVSLEYLREVIKLKFRN